MQNCYTRHISKTQCITYSLNIAYSELTSQSTRVVPKEMSHEQEMKIEAYLY